MDASTMQLFVRSLPYKERGRSSTTPRTRQGVHVVLLQRHFNATDISSPGNQLRLSYPFRVPPHLIRPNTIKQPFPIVNAA